MQNGSTDLMLTSRAEAEQEEAVANGTASVTSDNSYYVKLFGGA
jgi:hypothetical protein